MYDIGLPSHKALFQLYAERLHKLQRLVSTSATPVRTCGGPGAFVWRACEPRLQAVVPLFIMTSPLNHDVTVDFFRQHKFFGLRASDVHFFRQGTLPALTSSGKVSLHPYSTTAPKRCDACTGRL
jgi:UDP-N-acetylglucosamine/UDP-N-acetylgalactosamine diphosphorylase